jgi:hypothetical protein
VAYRFGDEFDTELEKLQGIARCCECCQRVNHDDEESCSNISVAMDNAGGIVEGQTA